MTALRRPAPRRRRSLHRVLLIVVALLAPLPVPAQESGPSSDLHAAIERGGTVTLSGGDHGALDLRNRTFDPGNPLVLRAADPADPPRFSGLLLARTANVVLEGLVLDYRFAPGDPPHLRPFRIENSSGIVLRDLLIDGDVARGTGTGSDGFPTAFGLGITGSTGVTLERSEIRGFYRGIVVGTSTDIVVRGNDIHALRMDGMNFAQVKGVAIEDNWIHDFDRSVDSADHADMIQFWTNGTTAPSEDIVIRGNLLNSGRGAYTQSIFMRNDLVDRGLAGPEMFYRNIVIENNFILNAHLHGIAVGETDGLAIRNNTVVRNPLSEGAQDNPPLWNPRISVSPASRDVAIERNVVSRLGGPEAQPDWVVRDNVFVQDEGRMRPNFYGTVFVGGDPRDPASFMPRPGGPLDGRDLGAPIPRETPLR